MRKLAPALAAAVVLVATAGTGTRAHADASAADADADDSRESKGAFGAGLVLGEPIGICAKLYIKDDRAIAAAVGSSFVAGGLQMTADYLFHPYILQKRPEFVLPFYVGPGLRFIDYRGNNTYGAFGVRAVAGMLFDFKKGVPLDAFVEAAFVLEHGLSDGHGFAPGINAGAGVRYYF